MSRDTGVGHADDGYHAGVRLELDLPRLPEAAGLARRALTDFLTDRGLTALVDDGTLVVSELVTNAVRYGGGLVRLEIDDLGGTLRLAVTDDRPDALPNLRPETPTAEGGRGLRLIAGLCPRWGVEPLADGAGDLARRKTVWAEFVLTGRR